VHNPATGIDVEIRGALNCGFGVEVLANRTFIRLVTATPFMPLLPAEFTLLLDGQAIFRSHRIRRLHQCARKPRAGRSVAMRRRVAARWPMSGASWTATKAAHKARAAESGWWMMGFGVRASVGRATANGARLPRSIRSGSGRVRNVSGPVLSPAGLCLQRVRKTVFLS
jgi:hypothetical protein